MFTRISSGANPTTADWVAPPVFFSETTGESKTDLASGAKTRRTRSRLRTAGRESVRMGCVRGRLALSCKSEISRTSFGSLRSSRECGMTSALSSLKNGLPRSVGNRGSPLCDPLEWVVLRNEEISTLSLDCLSELELLGVSCSCLSNQDFINLLKVLISIRENKVFFACDWENKWFWLADYVWGGFNCYWVAFLHAVDAYGLKDVIFNAGYIDIDEKHAHFKSNREKFGQNRVYNGFFVSYCPC